MSPLVWLDMLINTLFWPDDLAELASETVFFSYSLISPTLPEIDPKPMDPDETSKLPVYKVAKLWKYGDWVVRVTPSSSVPVTQIKVVVAVAVVVSAPNASMNNWIMTIGSM